MEFTLFDGAKGTVPTKCEADWAQICDGLSDWITVERHRSDKKAHPVMVPGRANGRGNANVEFLSALAADFDIGPDDPRYIGFHPFCDRLARDGFAFFAYTTTKNCGTHNRFRVILPYARTVRGAGCRAAWHACNDKFQGAIDRSTKDPARLSFLPANWIGNPFNDPTLGTVTLAQPFNALRVKASGKPILSAEEIAALDPIFSGEFAFPETVGTTKTPQSPEGQRQGYSHPAVTAVLTDADRTKLARGKAADAPCWGYLANLSRSPLVKRWMLEKLPAEEGSRDHRFLLALARNAIRQNHPVRVETLTDLAEQFSHQYLDRPAPYDIARQAENALAWAFNNPTEPRQSETGSNP